MLRNVDKTTRHGVIDQRYDTPEEEERKKWNELPFEKVTRINRAELLKNRGNDDLEAHLTRGRW